MNGIGWIFFDVGSTLVDETEAYNHRIRDAIAGTEITFEQFCEKRIFFQKLNLKGDIEAMNFFGLKKTPWHTEDERLYPRTADVLKELLRRGYKLGVIANQSEGTARRLEKWGILSCFDVIAASAEEGVAKPDAEIFRMALERAGCRPENAAMVGDRLDNDIAPAKALGMKTVWIKQGMSVFCSPKNADETPDYTVSELSELFEIFL